jgi:hypothetical protein
MKKKSSKDAHVHYSYAVQSQTLGFLLYYNILRDVHGGQGGPGGIVDTPEKVLPLQKNIRPHFCKTICFPKKHFQKNFQFFFEKNNKIVVFFLKNSFFFAL